MYTINYSIGGNGRSFIPSKFGLATLHGIIYKDFTRV